MGKRRSVRKNQTNLTPVDVKDVSSPVDWLSSIQKSNNNTEREPKNLKSLPKSPLTSFAEDLKCGRSTPELQIRIHKLNSHGLMTPNDSSSNDSDTSPTSGLKTSSFYGANTQSFQFSFRKVPLKVNKELKQKDSTIKNGQQRGKSGSLKRKHKSPKNSDDEDQAVKKTKIDDYKNGRKVKSNEIADGFANSKELCNGHCTTSSTMPDEIIESRNESLTGSPSSKENQILNLHFKPVIEDELGSFHSEDSLTSGLGSVKSSSLIKGQNGEYYFSKSNENSPDLTVNGLSKLCETPNSSSLANSPESEVSSTANTERTMFWFGNVQESDGNSYSPSCNSSDSVSPEHQTSITSFFKSSSKQSNAMGSPKSKKPDRSKRAIKDKKMEQMYLDLGQRNFGHVTCTRCGMVYTHAQPDDEIDHIRHHKKFVNGLRFNGWKDEHVVKEFNDGRIIMVKPDDHPSHLKKAEEIRKVVDSELGFAVDLPYRKNESKTFLFIAKKRVVGCCVATQIDKGYPVLPSTPTKDSTPDRQIAAWCCSTVPVPAQCGISKIWVWNQFRRKKVATRLIECVRTHFIYGCVITKDVLAFSDPTPDGKRLATAYIGIPEFLVFH